MLDFKLTLTGDLTEGLDKLEASIGEAALRAAGFAGAQVFQQEAKIRVPVRKGNLRDNIIVKRIEERSDANRRQVYYVTVRAGYAPPKVGVKGKKADALRALAKSKPGAYYWKFIEFGTSRMAAKPFMRPAFDSRVQDALEVMRAKLAEKIREATS